MPSLNRKSASHHGKMKPYWHISNMFRQVDHFSKEIPSFNLKGETNVTTLLGSIFTTLIVLVTLSYSLMKFEKVMTGRNADVTVFTELGHISADEKVNLNDISFRMAFVVEGFVDRERKADPRYVKYIARIWNEIDGE